MQLSLKRFAFSLLLVSSVFFVLAGGIRPATATGDYGLNETLNPVPADPTITANLGSALNKSSVDQGAGAFLSQKSGQIVGAILGFIGVIFLILMIYAGFSWMTASGNESQVDKAKNLITAAIIGLIIVLAAYAITAFIGNQIVGTSTTSTASTTGGTSH